MQICVLGTTRASRVDRDGDVGGIELGARKPRAVLAALALAPGHVVSADQLADLVWGGEPPRAVHGALHAYISGLRKAFDPARSARTSASVLETTDHGYVLRVPGRDVDAVAFGEQVAAAERTLAPLAPVFAGASPSGPLPRPEVADVLDRLDSALATWAGEPYADLPDHPDVLARRAGLERLRSSAEELRLLALLALGEHASVLSVTEAATALHPLRERLWALHALALTRAGRQVEALDALRALRTVLADELGLDPGAEVRALEAAVLQQRPSLLDPTVGPEDAAAPSRSASPVSASAATTRVVEADAPVGRGPERALLSGLLDVAASGRPAYGHVVGEPGIGKTRLVTDLAGDARERGFRVAVGRCSQDDGAPPLWPWAQVVEALGERVELPDDGGPGQLAFELRDRVARTVVDAARDRPLLVVLEDLHWADAATLRALVHLIGSVAEARLCLVATRRSHPGPTGPLALAAEALARVHATRLDLTGLDRADARELLTAVGSGSVPDEVVDAWHDRSAGNPFFLVELARLGAVGPVEVPATVQEVVTRRLELLPDRALDTLRAAAVVGRTFHPETVVAAVSADPDDVHDDLDLAVAAGLLVDGDDAMSFTHALTRDAVYLTMSSSRRARQHARVAHALETAVAVRRAVPEAERTAELARHWVAAGPSHADRAWRASRDAAAQARRLTDYATAARLGLEAVEAHRRVGAADEERFDLLMEVARDSAYAALWYQVVDAAFEAIALGRTVGRPDLVATAATSISRYTVWLPHDWQLVFEDVVDDLRWALHRLPDDAVDDRCRLQLALAVELYYDRSALAERRALVESGLAAARRSGDPSLRAWALRAAWLASWAPRHTEERLAYAEEGVAAAREAGDSAAEAVALVAMATDHLELAGPARWEELVPVAEAIALRDRLPYVELTICWVELNLAAIRHDAAGIERRSARMWQISQDVAIPANEIHPAATMVMTRMWDGGLREVLPHLVSVGDTQPMSWSTTQGMLARGGMLEELRDRVVRQPYTEPDETWQTLASFCWLAEAAAAVGDRGLAERCRRAVAPYTGRMAVAGVALAIGPVDGYLALVEAVLGDVDRARSLADRAEELARAWRLPAYLEWLAEQRRRHGL